MKRELRTASVRREGMRPTCEPIRKWVLTVLGALATVGLNTAPRLQAQGNILQRLWDFNQFALANETNGVASNYGGAAAVAVLIIEQPDILDMRQSTGSSPDSGTLFGTASLGGNASQGTVFSLNTDGTGFRVLHNFTNLDGAFPTAGLTLAGDTLYGTTVNGGSSDNGTVFAITTNGTGFRVLHSFSARKAPYYTNSDGGNPHAALLLAGGSLYGTTETGGAANAGTIFALNTNSLVLTVLHGFTATAFDADFNETNSDGANPSARLAWGDNRLYGTASAGGSGGAGTVFALATNGTGFQVLHAFTPIALTFGNSDGGNPAAGLAMSGDTLYGTAFQGGSGGAGAVFALNTNGTFFTNLYSFTGGADGAKPAGELLLLTNTLVGTTSSGGNTGGEGTVFSLKTDGTEFTVLYGFSQETFFNSNATNSDGANPQAGVVFSGTALYGTASGGGSGGNGTVFRLSAQTATPLTILEASLSGTNLVIQGIGPSGATYVTLISPEVARPLSQWVPAATNRVNASGNFTFTATNVVDPQAPHRFFILRSQ